MNETIDFIKLAHCDFIYLVLIILWVMILFKLRRTDNRIVVDNAVTFFGIALTCLISHRSSENWSQAIPGIVNVAVIAERKVRLSYRRHLWRLKRNLKGFTFKRVLSAHWKPFSSS